MAQATDVVPISIDVVRDGTRPSISVKGKANRSNISGMVDVLEHLIHDRRCVSLDLHGVESMDAAALESLAGSAGAFKQCGRRLHICRASDAVRNLLDRHQLSDAFCSCEDSMHGCNPETCGVATKAWEIDVFSYPSSLRMCREARDRVDRVAEAVGFSNCGRADIMLAVGEAITNAVKYGHNGDEEACFTVSCVATEERLCVSISDNGPGFDLNEVPSFEDALFSEHGRGVHCMNAVMDEVSFHFDAGTTVRMVKLGK